MKKDRLSNKRSNLHYNATKKCQKVHFYLQSQGFDLGLPKIMEKLLKNVKEMGDNVA